MKSARRTRPLPTRTRTILGVPPPLHLPASAAPVPDDTIVVDIEIAPDGQAYIERLP